MVTKKANHGVLLVGNYCHDVLIRDGAVLAETLGGAASFISNVLNGLSISCNLVAKVGRDFKYETSHIPIVVSASKTTVFHAYFDSISEKNSHRDRVLKRVCACDPIRPSDLPDAKFGYGMAVGVAGEILPETLDKMLEICDTVFVDIQSIIREFNAVDGTVNLVTLKDSGFYHLLPKIGVLKASSEEALFMDVEEVRKQCCVVVTNGEEGCDVYWREGTAEISPFLANQVDPTGAGDSFLGGFVAGLVQGLAVPDAALLGNLFGSITVGQIGLPKFDLKMLQRVKEEVQKRNVQCVSCSRRRDDDTLEVSKPSGHDLFYASLCAAKLTTSNCAMNQECRLDLPKPPALEAEQNFLTHCTGQSKLLDSPVYEEPIRTVEDSRDMIIETRATSFFGKFIPELASRHCHFFVCDSPYRQRCCLGLHYRKTKKKRRSRAAKLATNDSWIDKPGDGGRNGEIDAESLTEVFGSTVSLEEATGGKIKAEEFFSNLSEYSEYPSTTSSVSGGSSIRDSGSTSGSSFGFDETLNINKKRGGNKQKKVVAVTGTVANVLGKEYVRASPRKPEKFKEIADDDRGFDKEEVEQFCYSMLGDDCELSMADVRDVLCQCAYNVEKALEALLDLSASSNETSQKNIHCVHYKEDSFPVEQGDNLTDRALDCTSFSSDNDYDSIWSMGCNWRNYSEVLSRSAVCPTNKSDLPQKVLESFFNITKSPEHKPSPMNWRHVAKKLQSLGPGVNICQSSIAKPRQELSKGEEYQVLRKDAKEHWDSVKSYYHKASEAYSKGQLAYASYLSEQGKTQTKIAERADEMASRDIFKARNKGIENIITIDLHGQHVKPAMKLLKLHLLLGTYLPSIQTLRVITGCGTHGVGKSKLKQTVTKLLEKEGLEWREENRGTVLIKLDGYREFSFMDCDSDNE